MIICARLLGPNGFGQIAYLIWVVETARVFSNLGLPYTLTRHIAELHGRNQQVYASGLVRWIFYRYFILIILASVIVGLIANFTNLPENIHFSLLGLFLFFKGIEDLFLSFLSGTQQFSLRARINLFTSLILIVAVTLGAYFSGTKGALAGYIVGASFPALVGLLRFFHTRLRADELPENLKIRAWRYAFHAWIFYVVAVFIWSKIEVFFIKLYWPISEVGFFSAAFTFASLVAQGPVLFFGALIPHFAALSGAGDTYNLKKTFASAIRLTSLLLFPLCAIVVAIIPELLPIVYGSEYIKAVPTAIVLVFSSTLSLVFIGNGLLQGIGQSRFFMYSGLAGAFISCLAYLIFIPPFGSFGAAWARIIGHTFLFLMVFWFIRYRLDYSLPIVVVAKILFSALVCGLPTYAVASIQRGGWGIIFALLLGVTIYLFFIKYVSAIDVEDFESISKTISKFPKPTRNVCMICLGWLAGP